jgi:predicted RNA-binding Zn ribbon-like protein
MTETETRVEANGLPDPTVCLDFSNTLNGSRAEPKENLHAYPDLVAWSRSAGLVDERAADGLLTAAERDPAGAAATFDRAIALREAIFRIFSALAGGRATDPADLARLNAALATALGHLQVAPTPGGFGWTWRIDDGDPSLDRPLWPLARAAADLLTGDQGGRVRECASSTCDWLFMDQSRNHSRRWCDMADCGNRAKARRHYARQRAARAAHESGS